MKAIFFGTPDIAAKTLSFLLDNHINIVAVVTKPDRPQGRSGQPVATPVKQVALAHQPPIPLFQPEKVSNLEFAPTLAAFAADIFIVVAYGEIMRQHILDMPHLACINVHVSLLPKYRGAAPIQQAIIHGEKETGVTIMHMVKKLDAGDIIKTSSMPIDENITYGELIDQLSILGSEALLEVLKVYESGGTPPRYVQDEHQVTIAQKIELEDCEIDWKKPSKVIHDLVRGVNPEPGSWCFVRIKGEKKRLKIKRTRELKDLTGLSGSILRYGKEGFVVACETGAVEILELQLEGKKAMLGKEFTHGFKLDQISFKDEV